MCIVIEGVMEGKLCVLIMLLNQTIHLPQTFALKNSLVSITSTVTFSVRLTLAVLARLDCQEFSVCYEMTDTGTTSQKLFTWHFGIAASHILGCKICHWLSKQNNAYMPIYLRNSSGG